MSTATKPLQRTDAQVTTLKVEIKALKIGPKQMTQSVFRQLPYRSIFDDETAALLGVPWGTVNYFWKDCSPLANREHLHLVWEHGGSLYRDCVCSNIRASRHYGYQEARHKAELANEAINFAAGLLFLIQVQEHGEHLLEAWEGKKASVVFPVDEYIWITVSVDVSQNAPALSKAHRLVWDHLEYLHVDDIPYNWSWGKLRRESKEVGQRINPITQPWYREVIQESFARLNSLPGFHGRIAGSLNQYQSVQAFQGLMMPTVRIYIDESKAVETLINTWHEHYVSFLRLDQLFIAV